MIAIVIITNKISFSKAIVSYFLSQNKNSQQNVLFIPSYLENTNSKYIKRTFDEIKKTIKEKNKNIINCFIFTDSQIKQLVNKNKHLFKEEKFEINFSQGNILKNGFLTYLLANTSAPIESIKIISNKKI